MPLNYGPNRGTSSCGKLYKLNKGTHIKRIHPSLERARREAERFIKTNVKPIVKKIRRSFKKTFTKKRNQRRTVYIGGAIAITGLLTGLTLTQVHATNIETKYQHQLVEKEQQVGEKQKALQASQEALQQVEAVKVDTEAQLKAKADKEAQLQSELDKAKADLQVKADAEAEAARIAAIPTPVATVATRGGRGAVAAAESSGNGYDYGFCTWYVKNRRPDIPNSLGNANTWSYRAQSLGMATGSTPRVGAIGTTTAGALGHVVVVESVNADGTITISEMNGSAGWGSIDNRTTGASEFFYIY